MADPRGTVMFDQPVTIGAPGTLYAYGQMYPQKVGKILRGLDPRSPTKPEVVRSLMEAESGRLAMDPVGQGVFRVFRLTSEARDAMRRGQPLFSNPPTAGVVSAAQAGQKPQAGDTYERRYKTGPKAGQVEIVRRPRRKK